MQKKKLFFMGFAILLISYLMSGNSGHCFNGGTYIGSVSAIGNIQVDENVTLEVTVLNTYGSFRIRDVGLVLPYGLINQSNLHIEDVMIAGDSFETVNFSILINSTGDFQLLFYLFDGGGIVHYEILHLLVEAFPDELPIEIIVNETVIINETIPITLYEEVNVSNYLEINNYNNYSVLINETEYNNIINNISNNIYNDVYVTLINNISQWQWQNQSQWQNQTQWMYNNYMLLTQALCYLGFGLVGMYTVTTAKETWKIKKRKKTEEEYRVLNRNVVFGTALIGAVGAELTSAFLLFNVLPSQVQHNFIQISNPLIGNHIFGIIIALITYFMILGLYSYKFLVVSLFMFPILLYFVEPFIALWVFIFEIILLIVWGVILFIKNSTEESALSKPKFIGEIK